VDLAQWGLGIGDWGLGFWGGGFGGRHNTPKTQTQNTPTPKLIYYKKKKK